MTCSDIVQYVEPMFISVSYPDAPCMEYLPTFIPKSAQM